MCPSVKTRRNRYAEFRLVAEAVASRIKPVKGVAGIIFLGGLARGVADDDSDIDITVFVDTDDEGVGRELRKVVRDAQQRSGFEIDFEIHETQDFARRKWDEVDRWELGKAEIVFDPSGVIRRLFQKGARVPGDFWTTRIVECCTYLRWYCCPQAGQKCMAETWIDRGDPLSAHYCIHYSIDLMLELVFALNREFFPPQKWRLQYARDLRWLPKDFEMRIAEMSVVKAHSRNELRRRLDAAGKMWPEVIEKVEIETGLTTENIARYYVENILGQTWTSHA